MALALTVSACGSSSSKSKSSGSSGAKGTLALTISGSGSKASYSGPTSITGGLVRVSLHNAGTVPHTAQLVLLDPPHTIADALAAKANNSPKTPGWIHFEGGVGTVGPGATATATDILPAGNYGVADVGGGSGSGSNGPPAVMKLTVKPGSSGSLPSTPTTVTAAAAGKDKYKWQISGSFSTGQTNLTFNSKGSDTQHLIAAARITGKHSQAEIIKALSSNGPPPPWIDPSSLASTAGLDSGRSQVASLRFAKPGTYVLFCPLTDRDGGKPHFAEGLETTVTVK